METPNSDTVMAPGPPDSQIDLTFAIPMYNEEEIVQEAVERVLKAGADSGLSFELLAVDDGSQDTTPHILARLQRDHPQLRWVRLQPNCGQPAASKAGMAAARGRMVAVLDADLQTPPELVPTLARALEEAGPKVEAVFGTTSTRKRDDPPRLLAGQAVFYFLQTRLTRHRLPHGASSFFVMRQDAARRIARLRFTKGNIAAVMAALGMEVEAVSYVKPASYRDDSRLGLRGHAEEAVGSLALTGFFDRLGAAGALLCTREALRLRRSPAAAASALAGVGLSLLTVRIAQRFRNRALSVADTALPIHEGTPDGALSRHDVPGDRP